jgi:hypothetical protein
MCVYFAIRDRASSNEYVLEANMAIAVVVSWY